MSLVRLVSMGLAVFHRHAVSATEDYCIISFLSYERENL